MKSYIPCLAAIIGTTFGAVAQDLFLESVWQNNLSSPGVALWAGGNESTSGPGIGNPYSANGIYLVESAIGQMTAQTLAYPGADSDLASGAAAATLGAQTYRYTNSLGIIITNPAVTWTIVFPGGFNPATGLANASVTAGALNYDTNALAQAEHDLRAILRINPLDTDAAKQLVLLADARIAPLEWSGTAALAYAEKARLLGLTTGGTNQETIAVELARGYFQNACDVFSQFLGNPSDASLVEGQNTFLSAGVTNQVAQILDDYLRNLAEYASASLTDFQIRSLAQFYDPSQPQPGQAPAATRALLDDIDNTSSEIQLRLLLASPFQSLPMYTASAAGEVQTYLAQIGRMHESVLLGRVTFIAGDSGDASTNASLYYGEYSTAFVPIFSGLAYPQGGNSSFDIALAQALNFAAYATNQEAAAADAVSKVATAAYDYTKEQSDLQQQYNNQLVNLCGYGTVDTNGNPVPDIFLAALQPGVRESTAAQLLTNATYDISQNTGAIYQQWLAVQQAETNLVYASLQLSNTVATMIEKSLVAYAIHSNDLQLAALDLSDGQQISAIDVQEGEAKAQGDLTVAQIQHDEAVQKARNSIWGGVLSVVGAVAGVVLAPLTGGASLTLSAALIAGGGALEKSGPAAYTAAENGYDEASADLAIGQAKANTDMQLAQYNAQIEQINSAEKAALQYASADTVLLNLSADLNSLRLQAQSQSVQIQLAAQGVDQQRSKLATLMGQVAYLLRQYARSVTMITGFSSNLLIARNAALAQADDAFILAQQWAFLTVQSFNYEDNCPDVTSSNYLQRVLGARTASALFPVLNDMESAHALIAAGCQSSVFCYTSDPLSLRNNSFQFNLGEGTNASFEPILLGGMVGTNAAASLAAWTVLLSQNILTNDSGRVLALQFSTTLDNEFVGGHQRNPLFNSSTFGTTIFFGPPPVNNGTFYNGVQVNIATDGTPLPSSFIARLAQNGASAIRDQGFCDSASSAPAFRYFNFGPYAAEVSASVNGFAPANGSDAFHDRSPANAQWILTFNEVDGDNADLLDNLSHVTDIQLQFGIRSYTDLNCN
jgi:hypothetical protein